MLNYASSLLIASLGMAIAFNIGFFNLGGEGQIYFGGFIAAIFLSIFSSLNGFVGIFLAITIASLGSGIISVICAYLKVKWDVFDLISTYLVSHILILIVNYLITSKFNDTNSNLLATNEILQKFHLARILPPSYLNISIFIAILFAILLYVYLYKTRFGYETIISGQSKEFSRYGGINLNRYVIISGFLSGALMGISGATIVLGTNYRAIYEFQSGIGFTAIAVSLIAKNNPILVIFASLFLAYIKAGAMEANINTDSTVEIAYVVEAAIFFIITMKYSPAIFKKIKDKIF